MLKLLKRKENIKIANLRNYTWLMGWQRTFNCRHVMFRETVGHDQFGNKQKMFYYQNDPSYRSALFGSCRHLEQKVCMI